MKRLFILIGGIMVLLLLLVGGYTAMQLSAEPEAETAVASSGGGRVMQSVKVGNDGVPVSVQTTTLPAEELPDTEAAAFGIVLARQDDTLTIGTGAIDLAADLLVFSPLGGGAFV